MTTMELDFTLLEALLVYFDYGLDPGGCGKYILLHDLENAQPRQHMLSRHTTPDMIRWVKAYLPRDCQGSLERFDAWIAQGGVRGWDTPDGVMYRLDTNRQEIIRLAKESCGYVPFEERKR